MLSLISRRDAPLAGSALLYAQARAQSGHSKVERWGIFEATLNGPSSGNPFLDVTFSAQFKHEHRAIDVTGFYEGAGVYKVRCMPDAEGEWSYTTRSDRPELDRKTGAFTCVPLTGGNHGPA